MDGTGKHFSKLSKLLFLFIFVLMVQACYPGLSVQKTEFVVFLVVSEKEESVMVVQLF